MKRFSTAAKQEHGKLVDRLHETKLDLEHAIEKYNDEIGPLFEPVREAQEALQSVIADANAFLDGVRDEAQTYYDDRSEKWQEDEGGQSYQEWISELESTIDDVEIEAPEELSDPDIDLSTFEDVRQGVDD